MFCKEKLTYRQTHSGSEQKKTCEANVYIGCVVMLPTLYCRMNTYVARHVGEASLNHALTAKSAKLKNKERSTCVAARCEGSMRAWLAVAPCVALLAGDALVAHVGHDFQVYLTPYILFTHDKTPRYHFNFHELAAVMMHFAPTCFFKSLCVASVLTSFKNRMTRN